MAADLAMYDAKHEGRRRTAFYDGGAKSSTHSRLQWVDRIRTALAEERLALLAQPIVDLDTRPRPPRDPAADASTPTAS